MKRIVFITILILLVVCPLYGQNGEVPSQVQTFGKINAPKYKFTDLNKNLLNWHNQQGRVVIIDCWTTWCKPCQQGVAELQSLQSQYQHSISIMGLSLDKSLNDLQRYLKNDEHGQKINYPIIYGKDFAVYFGSIKVVPTKFILDKEGYIRYELNGYTARDEIAKYLDKLLAE
jgi:thiol-disulfide isomerase/thioredoxin